MISLRKFITLIQLTINEIVAVYSSYRHVDYKMQPVWHKWSRISGKVYH